MLSRSRDVSLRWDVLFVLEKILRRPFCFFFWVHTISKKGKGGALMLFTKQQAHGTASFLSHLKKCGEELTDNKISADTRTKLYVTSNKQKPLNRMVERLLY